MYMPFSQRMVSCVMVFVVATLMCRPEELVTGKLKMEEQYRLVRLVQTCICCFGFSNSLLQGLFGGEQLESAALLSQLKLQPFEKQEKRTEKVRQHPLPAECLSCLHACFCLSCIST